jgi:hypothetical protein
LTWLNSNRRENTLPKCETADPGKCLGKALTVVRVRETDSLAMIDVQVCVPCRKLIESINGQMMLAYGCFKGDYDDGLPEGSSRLDGLPVAATTLLANR